MSKYIKIALFLLLIFLFKAEPVSARFYGSYRYDIDSATITDTSITIEGWAAINKDGDNETYIANRTNGGTAVDNDKPTYTLKINAVDGSGNIVQSLTYPTYNFLKSTISTNNDYSRSWYDDIVGVTNYKYVGIDFKFVVDVNTLSNVVKAKPTVNHFELILNEKLSSGYNKDIKINFQSTVVTNTATKVFIANDLLTSVRAIVVQARALNSRTIGGDVICYNQTAGVYYSTSTDETCTFGGVTQPSDHAYITTGETYNVNARARSTVVPIYTGSGTQINSYVTNGAVSLTSFYNFGTNVYKFMPGGSKTTYVPSAWIIPPTDNSIWLSIGPPQTPTCAQGAMQCYCATHPTDTAFCNTINIRNVGTSKSASCSSGGKTNISFQEPQNGYGSNVTSNTACKIDCQEDLTVKFQKSPILKAGTGFEYPVSLNSTLYCTAQYTNDTWRTTWNNAVKTAIAEYPKITSNLKSAISEDNACGSKYTGQTTPGCPSAAWTRSGGTCKGTKVVTDCTACGFTINPITKAKVCKSCSVPTSQSVSCPKYNNISTSYNSSSDKCEVSVCKDNKSTKWSTAQNTINGYLNAANTAYSNYTGALNTLTTLTNDRRFCDSYNPGYGGPKNTDMTTNNSLKYQSRYESPALPIGVTQDGAYTTARQTYYTNTVKVAPNPYDLKSCKYTSYTFNPYKSTFYGGGTTSIPQTKSYCTSYGTSTYPSYPDFRTVKYDSSYTLEFSKTYAVRSYTGEVTTNLSASGYVVDGKKEYTDFYALTGAYPFSIYAKTLGPNLPSPFAGNNKWFINTLNCNYNVTNYIFPQKNDVMYPTLGSVGFTFRPVSLTDPFPNRSARDNWRGNEYLITSKGYNVYATTPLYTLTLTPATMQNIRGFKSINNNVYGYSDASNPANSKLIDQYSSVIVKRK